ncbi:hypothetical protein [Cerasicoccus arenae]|uniref:hypothetical protein n=1 Tax=Cerasicoccus arenae TaxID=424488 RepID=UPI00167839F8|nr:hypothetical protein [Cerasicoccus arenae]MBK1859975.1 hypothetical protein [Cerasicoccus arenae]
MKHAPEFDHFQAVFEKLFEQTEEVEPNHRQFDELTTGKLPSTGSRFETCQAI